MIYIYIYKINVIKLYWILKFLLKKKVKKYTHIQKFPVELNLQKEELLHIIL